MNKIEGVVRLVTPLHVAAFDRNDAARSAPNMTPMMKQRIFAEGEQDTIPYFPANDIRGRMRRKAARLVLDALAEQDIRVNRELYAGLMAGAVTSKIEPTVTVEELQRAKRNLYMGVFGGGARMIRTHYRPRDMVPVIASTVEAGMVPKEFANGDTLRIHTNDGKRDAAGYHLLNSYVMVRQDDVFRVMDIDSLQRHLDNLESVTEYQASILENRKTRRDAQAAQKSGEADVEQDALKKSDVSNLYSVEAIAPGTPLYFRLDFDDLDDAQIGLLLSALRDMLQEPLGGLVRAGMGRVDARQLTLHIQDNDEPVPLFEEDDEDQLSFTDPAARYVDAMREALKHLDYQDLQSYFMPSKDAEALLKASS